MTTDAIIARIRDSANVALDGMLEAPPMYGTPMAVECQFLMALETWRMAVGLDVETPRAVMDAWIRYVARHVPEAGCRALSNALESMGRGDELTEHLRAFRAQVQAVAAPEAPARSFAEIGRTAARDAQRAALLGALEGSGWRLSVAADALQMSGTPDVLRQIHRLDLDTAYNAAKAAGLIVQGRHHIAPLTGDAGRAKVAA
jgi:hypothetical protein